MHPVLEGIIRNQRIASAYLFVGPPDSAKGDAAEAFAAGLGCHKIDQLKVAPDGSSLKIEQIRELQQVTRYGPSVGRYLLATLERADALTEQAAAAFLKTLEEPPPGVVFVLLAEREDRLPATLVSRCQKLVFGEQPGEWQPHPQWSAFYDGIKNIRQKSMLELYNFAGRLEKEERIEELFYDLIFYAKNNLRNVNFARVMLEAVKNIKKKANLKLTLEVACLKLWSTN